MALDIKFPRKPKSGEPLTAAWGRDVVATMERIALMPGVGYLLKRGVGGTALEILAKGKGGGATPRYLELRNASTSAGDVMTLKLGVTPAWVNETPPTLGGTAVDATPAPTHTITTSTWAWLKVVGTFGATTLDPDTYVSTIEFTTTSAPPVANSLSGTGFVYCRALGNAVVASGAITSLFAVPVADANIWVKAEGFGVYEFPWRQG
jgi:hypothetical protein